MSTNASSLEAFLSNANVFLIQGPTEELSIDAISPLLEVESLMTNSRSTRELDCSAYTLPAPSFGEVAEMGVEQLEMVQEDMSTTLYFAIKIADSVSARPPVKVVAKT